MKNKIALSISILMSGRKETRKCLESIKPILEQVSCELILVDTGCDEEKLSILKEYTSIIIPFEWCNDFSKARNIGLKKATGEWFMFLDDDEWFDDVTPIIKFFNSGEYKKYNSATYRQRNYHRTDESIWGDAYVTRMTKIFDETIFKSSIHEYISPMYAPNKMLDCYVKHFGYLFDNEEDRYKHSMRNISLLLEMLEKEPDNIRWDLQIIQEYNGIAEYLEVEKIGKRAKDKINNNLELYNNDMISLGTIYGFIISAYANTFDWDNMLKYAIEGLENNISALAKAYIYMHMAKMYYVKKNFEKCTENIKLYFEIYDRIGEDKEQIFLQGKMILQNTFANYRMDQVFYHGIISAIELNNDDLFRKYLERINWKETSILVFTDFIEKIIKYLSEQKDCEKYICFINSINLEDKLEKYMAKKIQKFEKVLLKKEEYYKFNILVKLFSNINGDNWYFTYLKILNEDLNSNIESLEELYRILFSKVTDIFNINDRLWKIVDKYNLDIIGIFDEIDFDRWQIGIDNWICHTDMSVIQSVEEHFNKWLCGRQNLSYKYNYLFMKIYEGKLYCICKNENESELDEEVEDKEDEDNVLDIENIPYNVLELEEIFTVFIDKTVDYYQRIYKNEIFTSVVDILPIQCRFALDMQIVIEQRKNIGNDIRKEKELLIQIKNLAEKYENFAKVLDIYAKLIVKSVEEQENKSINQENINKEMLQLASALKIKAREFIEQGNNEQAARILQQVIMYVPADKEAKEIMMMIEE